MSRARLSGLDYKTMFGDNVTLMKLMFGHIFLITQTYL